jgi:menaquinol-cytochrome c reductase iron-sulfur subunit
MMCPSDSHAPSPSLGSPTGTRRRFFQWMITASAGVIGLGLTFPLIGYLVSPAFKRRTQAWVDVGAVGDLAAGVPTQLEYMATVQDGYHETKTQKAVWAIKQPGDDVTVFSPMCPHLGCGYHWDRGEQKFKCPCHGSVFDVSGRVVGGPAPRPLDVLPYKVEGGRLLVVYKEFKSGVAQQTEL